MRESGARVARALAAGMLALLFASPAFAAGEHEGGHGESSGHGHDDGHGHAHGAHGFDFGAAAPNAEPDRIIEITAYDTMEFDPDHVSVETGEVVRFVVRNAGSVQHSFTLGSPEYQQKHEEEMQGMPMDKLAGHMKNEPNGIVIPPGETGTLTWRFEKGGPVQFACHIPGHYPAGMMGELSLE